MQSSWHGLRLVTISMSALGPVEGRDFGNLGHTYYFAGLYSVAALMKPPR